MSTHAWMPSSPCGPGCTAAAAPTAFLPRQMLRLLGLLAVLAGALLLAPPLVLISGAARHPVIRVMFAGVLRTLGVRLQLHGDVSFGGTDIPRGVLVVSNHVSWLDIVALNSARPMRSLAKSEIRGWPLIGMLAARAGTLFLDRDRLRSLPGSIGELTGALRAGATIGVHPEGTTWCGLASGRFRPAVFQAAIDGGVPVRPVALRYALADGSTTTRPAFVGDDTLVNSVRRVLCLRSLMIELYVGAEIAPGSAADRRELAALAEKAVRANWTDRLLAVESGAGLEHRREVHPRVERMLSREHVQRQANDGSAGFESV